MRKLHKVLTVGLMCVFLLILGGISAFASPDTLPGDVVTTKEGLVYVKAPELESSSTTNAKLAISATASEGTVVTVYKYNFDTGLYEKLWMNDAPVEATVGPSLLYVAQVDLTPGLNKFLVRGAWDENTYAVARFEVNLLNEDFMDRIKGIINVFF